MAGILERFKTIMSSNINALLDKMEDPEKMIDQYLRDMEKDLGSVKAETVAVMAQESAAKRKVAECEDEIKKMLFKQEMKRMQECSWKRRSLSG